MADVLSLYVEHNNWYKNNQLSQTDRASAGSVDFGNKLLIMTT